jgi:hypothetical protein
MLQQGTLTFAFKTYWDEMETCLRAKAYWSLLHVIVCLPDLCSALEAKNGQATQKLYID